MILSAKGIKKRFTHPQSIELLKGIDLAVESGQTIAIMGRSGEGKSTLLQILGTLDTPSEGTLEIAGKQVSNRVMSEIRNHHIGFVFQSFYLLEDYTVLQNVLMPAAIARKPIHKGSAAYERGVELLTHVGLGDRLHHFGKQLSGGEQQRAAIARALCNDPDLILADEPSGNLDSQTAEVIYPLLLKFPEGKKKAVVIVTHDERLASLCDVRYSLQGGILT